MTLSTTDAVGASVCADDGADNRQAQSTSAVGTGTTSIDAVEAVKKRTQMFRRYTWSRVDHFDSGACIDGARPNRYRRIVWRVAQSIRGERQHSLSHPVRHGFRDDGPVGVELDVPVRGNDPQIGYHVANQPREVDLLACADAVLVKVGEIKKRLDEPAHASCFGVDPSHGVAYRRPISQFRFGIER